MSSPIAGGDRAASSFLARQRIRLAYLWRHARLPDLAHPQRFTECVQTRKLYDRDPAMPAAADKLRVKAHVADRLGPQWVTPTLWHGTELPPAPLWRPPFVVKARHGCNQTAFVRDDAIDWPALRRRAARWTQTRYGALLDEWLYDAIPRGLIVEPFVGDAGRLPVDYKFYVFGGRVEMVQAHLDREGAHCWLLYDREWRRRSCFGEARDAPPPRALDAMIAAAETLGADFDFVRVDLYDLDSGPRFGEMTFYPGSGLDRFDPVSLDSELGALWRAAAAAADPRRATLRAAA